MTLVIEPVVRFCRLKSGGYKLTHDFCGAFSSLAGCAARVEGFIELTQDGFLTIREGYYSDGMSGPLGEWDDSDDTMAAAFVHDALYQLGRGGHLPEDWRGRCDDIFEEICQRRGMTWARRRFLRLCLWVGGRGAWRRKREIEAVEHEA